MTNLWDKGNPLQSARKAPGSVMKNDKEWWLVGGKGDAHTTSELFNEDVGSFLSNAPLPNSATENQGNCILKINDTHYFAHGLVQSDEDVSLSSHFYTDFMGWSSPLPNFSKTGRNPTCGIIRKPNGDQEVIIAGGDTFNGETHIFSLKDNRWRYGPCKDCLIC